MTDERGIDLTHAERVGGAAGRALTVALPLPSHDLTANGRLHWARRAALVRETRRQAAILARQAMLDADWAGTRFGPTSADEHYFPRGARVRVDYVAVLPPGRRRWDDTALIEACKAVIDGLTDAGVWGRDACAAIGAVTWERDRALAPAASGALTLTLTEEPRTLLAPELRRIKYSDATRDGDMLGGAPGGARSAS